MKIWKRENTYLFWCPGCDCGHLFWTNHGWQWNENYESPTVSPSILNTSVHLTPKEICHIIITDGKIHYCPDSTHALSGQIIEMQDIPEDYGF